MKMNSGQRGKEVHDYVRYDIVIGGTMTGIRIVTEGALFTFKLNLVA
jgi:hypothetical protein